MEDVDVTILPKFLTIIAFTYFLFELPFSSRNFPDAQFLWTHPSSSQSAPEFWSHAAHGPNCPLHNVHHAQQLTEHPSGTNADLLTKRNADKHTTSSAAHRNKPANSNAD